MRRTRWTLVIALAVGTPAGAPAQDTASVPSAPRVLWHYPGTRTSFQAPVFHRGLVYVGGERLVALSPVTGQPLHAAREAGPWSPPQVHGDVVIAHRRGSGIYAFVFTLDRLLWHSRNRVAWRLAGAVCGDAYVVPSANDLIGLSLADGRQLWRRDVDDGATVSLATDGERVYYGTGRGRVVAVRGVDGTEVWRAETGSKFAAGDPVVHDGTLLIADRGRGDGHHRADRGKQPDEVRGGRAGALHAFDAATGKHLWGRIFGATGCSRPHVHDGYVWAGFGRSVARFDLRKAGALDMNGAITTGANAFGSPTVVGGHIVFGNLDGHLYVHERKTGALTWAFEPGAAPGHADRAKLAQVGAFTFAGGRLFVTTAKGLYAIDEDPDANPAAPGFVLRIPE